MVRFFFGVSFLSSREKVSQFSNEGVLHGGVIVGRLCDDVRASYVGIGVNAFFPSETNGMEIIVRAGCVERGPCFDNHFVNGAKTIIAVIYHRRGFWSGWRRRGVRDGVDCKGIGMTGGINPWGVFGRNGMSCLCRA